MTLLGMIFPKCKKKELLWQVYDYFPFNRSVGVLHVHNFLIASSGPLKSQELWAQYGVDTCSQNFIHMFKFLFFSVTKLLLCF